MDEVPLRQCGRCRAIKPVGDFNPSKQGGYQGYCKACHQEYKREHYRKNREKYIASALRIQRQLRSILLQNKARPCADCGRRFPPYVMDFDHREGEKKLFNVSALNHHRWVSVGTLLAKIAKCELVCANCHRERTHQRRCRKKAAASG